MFVRRTNVFHEKDNRMRRIIMTAYKDRSREELLEERKRWQRNSMKLRQKA